MARRRRFDRREVVFHDGDPADALHLIGQGRFAASITTTLGDTVTVRGTLDDDTIRIASIELMSIGLAVGQKAPAFSARDQFGEIQTLDSLKGTNGTVLLFFRSADW